MYRPWPTFDTMVEIHLNCNTNLNPTAREFSGNEDAMWSKSTVWIINRGVEAGSSREKHYVH